MIVVVFFESGFTYKINDMIDNREIISNIKSLINYLYNYLHSY